MIAVADFDGVEGIHDSAAPATAVNGFAPDAASRPMPLWPCSCDPYEIDTVSSDLAADVVDEFPDVANSIPTTPPIPRPAPRTGAGAATGRR